MKALIEVKDLSKSFGEKKILKNISVDIREGDVVCVIGPSGSGKSTFLRCLNRLEEPTDGHIFFEGVDICDKNTNIENIKARMSKLKGTFNLQGIPVPEDEKGLVIRNGVKILNK